MHPRKKKPRFDICDIKFPVVAQKRRPRPPTPQETLVALQAEGAKMDDCLAATNAHSILLRTELLRTLEIGKDLFDLNSIN